MEFLGAALAVLIGLTLGVLGAGGSILTVPVFVYVLGFDAKLAIAMSLPVVGVASLVGAIGHWRSGNVQIRTALIFGAIAMLGSYAGARLAAFVAAGVQLTILGIVMWVAALSMLRSAAMTSEHAVDGPSIVDRPWSPLIGATALGVGLLTGLVGVGGGFLIVPALVLLAQIPMKQAIGTSLTVIAMNAASGTLGYAGRYDLPWTFMLLFTTLAVAGIIAGTYLVRFVSQRALRRVFALLLLGLGALILYRSFPCC